MAKDLSFSFLKANITYRTLLRTNDTLGKIRTRLPFMKSNRYLRCSVPVYLNEGGGAAPPNIESGFIKHGRRASRLGHARR